MPYDNHPPNLRDDISMRKFDELGKEERELLIMGEVVRILNILENGKAGEWRGIEQLIIDYDELVFMPTKSTEDRVITRLVSKLIQEAEYCLKATSFPSELVIN
jgi:hypothetical protein